MSKDYIMIYEETGTFRRTVVEKFKDVDEPSKLTDLIGEGDEVLENNIIREDIQDRELIMIEEVFNNNNNKDINHDNERSVQEVQRESISQES